MYPINIKLGFLKITIEGLFAVGTLLLGFYYQRRKSMAAGYSEDWFITAYTVTVASGMVFARLFHFLFWDTSSFFANPAIFLRGGGFAILGATAGASLGGWLYCKYSKTNFLHWCDCLMAPIALCLMLGRVACFLNGDAYGLPTESPLGMVFSERSVDWMREWRTMHGMYAGALEPLKVIATIFGKYSVSLQSMPLPAALDHLRAEGVHSLADLARYYPPNAILDPPTLVAKGLSPFPAVYPRVHPTQLYEIVIMFFVFLIVLRLENIEWARRKLFFIFWILYGMNRFVIEIWRFDRNIAVGQFTYAQIISVIAVILAAAGLIYTTKKWRLSGRPEAILK